MILWSPSLHIVSFPYTSDPLDGVQGKPSLFHNCLCPLLSIPAVMIDNYSPSKGKGVNYFPASPGTGFVEPVPNVLSLKYIDISVSVWTVHYSKITICMQSLGIQCYLTRIIFFPCVSQMLPLGYQIGLICNCHRTGFVPFLQFKVYLKMRKKIGLCPILHPDNVCRRPRKWVSFFLLLSFIEFKFYLPYFSWKEMVDYNSLENS